MPKILLRASNIEKYYAENKLFSFNELKVYSGDKIGLIGSNGSGKTTLLNILFGNTSPDKGTLEHYCDISFITQFDEQDLNADKKSLSNFKLTDKQLSSKLSGGEYTRLKLASAFSKENMLLFADEPTSNLDINGVELFCEKMLQTESFIIISHDRALLDKLCNRIIEIKDRKLEFYSDNYSSYETESIKKEKNALLLYNNYELEKAHLKAALNESKTKAKFMRKAPKRMGNSEARLHKGKTSEKKKKLDQTTSNLKKRIEKLEIKQKPIEQPKIKMDFSLTDPPKNKIVIFSNHLDFAYGNNSMFIGASFEIKNGSKLALCGENGCGKTTLLNRIFNRYKDINIAPKAKLRYFYQGFENIDYNKSVLDNALDGSVQSKDVVRTILARLLFLGDSVYKPAGVLSGGERIKLSFAKLLVSDTNVLLLDEPTNYLDLQSIEVLQALLKAYEGTAVFVSHDTSFVNSVADTLMFFTNKKLAMFNGNIDMYEQTQCKQNNSINYLERTILQMKLTEIVSKLSDQSSDKDMLNSEYKTILEKLKN